jgi:hypothetical protein
MDLGKHINGNFDQKSTAQEARYSPKAVLRWPLAFLFATGHVRSGCSHSCCVLCHLEEMLCSGT